MKENNFKCITAAGALGIFLLFLLSQPFAEKPQTTDTLSLVDSVLIYSNGMALVSSSADANITEAGRVKVKLINFTQNALLPTIKVEAGDGEVFWLKRYLEEKKIEEEYYMPFDELLNQSYNETVKVKTEDGEIEGKLLWVSEGKIGIEKDGKLVIVAEPEKIELSAKKTKEKQEKSEFETGLEIYMNAYKSGGQKLLLNYVATGASWTPSYNFEISKERKAKGKISALAQVENNADEDWNSTVLRLAVGSPYFVEHQFYPRYAYGKKMMAMEVAAAAPAAPSFEEEYIATQYIYTLSEPVTILKNEKANLNLFEAQIDYEKDNLWQQYGAVQKIVKIKNEIGKPIAAGVVRVYEEGVFAGEAYSEYIGEEKEDEIAYAAFPQITVEKEENQTTEKPSEDRRETFYSVLMNITSSAKEDEPLTLRDYMHYGDKVELIESSVPAVQPSGNQLEWKVKVPAGKSITITYKYKVTNFERVY